MIRRRSRARVSCLGAVPGCVGTPGWSPLTGLGTAFRITTVDRPLLVLGCVVLGLPTAVHRHLLPPLAGLVSFQRSFYRTARDHWITGSGSWPNWLVFRGIVRGSE